jgi:tRNA nucleotidyltransferase (CCA-adding enzyme)
MKVTFEKNWKEVFTIADKEAADLVIKFEKEEDESTIEDWCMYAGREALKETTEYVIEILKAEAVVTKNHRARDAYGTGTRDIDVMISFIAETTEGMLKASAYLSDIWKTGAESYRNWMYVKRFAEV